MQRRRFDHLFVLCCVSVDALLPRYRFWLALHDAGFDPEQLGVQQALAFLDSDFEAFLHTHGAAIRPRARRSLRRRVARFDPTRPTPEERLAALT